MADCLEDDQMALHMHYKWRVIARLPQDRDWSISDTAVRQTIADIIIEGRKMGLQADGA